MLEITSRVIASCFALVSFAAALLVGVMAENPLPTVLGRALFTMIVCYAVGLVVGGVAQRTVDQHIEHHKQHHPIPDPHALTDADEASPATPTASGVGRANALGNTG
ncbi:MAG: hypothetical protein AAFX76_03245 [Planctomycetota bacterium]